LQKQRSRKQNWRGQKTGIWAKRKNRGKLWTNRQFKSRGESRDPQLDSNNRFHVLTRMKVGISNSEGVKERNRKQESKKKVEMRKAGEEGALRKITVKIELERINTQKEITVEALLDSRAMGLVMSSEFARK